MKHGGLCLALKALSNDIQKDLEGLLAEIAELAKREGHPFSTLRIAVRRDYTSVPECKAWGSAITRTEISRAPAEEGS